MKTLTFFVCGLLASLLRAEEPQPSYLVVAPESMDPVLVERVQGWMSTNLFYEVRVQRLPDWEGGSGEAQLKVLKDKIERPGIVTVVLSDRLEDEKHAVVFPNEKLGIVNVPLLAPEVNETTLRRLDRQAIRIVGFSLGVPPQPIPFCALYPYENLNQLDQIGRGFSPPAMALYRRQLMEHGVPLSPDAEKFLPKANVGSPQPPMSED